MFLLGEPIDKTHTFQAHAVRLATKTEMWSARYQMLHPGRTTGIASRKVASGEYAEELKRTEKKHLPVSRMLNGGLPSSTRKELLGLWLVAFPTPREF